MNDGTAIIYCRVSSDDQVEGTSLETQERLCREYAAKHRLEVLECFVEAGVSAKTANRPELLRAVAFCRERRVRNFLVYKLDRFARNHEDHIFIRARLRRYGTELRSVTEPIDGTAGGEVMEGMLSLFAQYDNRLRSERTLHGMEHRVREGYWVWQAPYGYRRGSGLNIEPDPETAPFVRQAFVEYSSGAYSFQRLAQKLAREGMRSPTGRKPDAQLLNRMLRNPIYCGVIQVWGDEYQGSFQPLVSRELFDACQVLNGAGGVHAAPRSLNNPLFPLRGFVRCAECNRPLTGSQSRGQLGTVYPYYHHYNRDCASVRWLPKDRLEREFGSLLDRYSIKPSCADGLSELAAGHTRELNDAVERHLAVVRRQLADLELERQRIFDYHRGGTYSTEEFLEQKAMLNRRMNEKQLLLKKGEAGDEALATSLGEVLRMFERPRDTWYALANAFSRRVHFQKLIFPSGVQVDGTRLRTSVPSLIYQLSEAFSGDKNQVVPLLIKRWEDLTSEVRRWSDFLKGE